MLAVHAVGALTERHEQVVAQQVGLGEAHAGGVMDSKNLVRALTLRDRHEHQSESRSPIVVARLSTCRSPASRRASILR